MKMKSFSCFSKLMAAAVCCLAFAGNAFATLSTTTIDGKTYYQIGTCQDLHEFSSWVNDNHYNANAVLTANIDMNLCQTDGVTTSFTPIGDYSSSTSKIYTGTFDGAGKTITGLRIAYNAGSGTGIYLGLVGYLGTYGVVKDVVLYDVNLSSSTGSGKDDFIGGVAGGSQGTIENCTVAGASTIAARRTIGGIVGYAYGGKIINCLSSAKLLAVGQTDARTYVGGIAARADARVEIKSCVYLGTQILRCGNNDVKDGTKEVCESESSQFDPLRCVELCTAVSKYDDVNECAIACGSATVENCLVDGSAMSGLNHTIDGAPTTTGADWSAEGVIEMTAADMNTDSVVCMLNNGTWYPDPINICQGGNGPWTTGDDITNHGGTHTGDATSFDITFDPNGGAFTDVAGSKVLKVDALADIDVSGLTPPVRDGDEFLGWAKNNDMAMTQDESLGKATSAMTFYAVWNNSVMIKFDANGGTFSKNAVTSKRVARNAAITADGISTPEAPLGTTFLGWSTNENATDADNPLGTTEVALTFYAVYAGSFTVTFNSNGHGSFPEGAVRTQVFNIGETITAEEITQPTEPVDYTFVGWSRDASAKVADANLGVMGTAPVTIYAVWQENTVAITFNPNEGYFNGSNTEENRRPKSKDVRIGDVINSSGISESTPPVQKEPYYTDSTCTEYACASCNTSYELKNGQCTKKNNPNKGSVGSCKTTSSTCRQWSFTTHNYTFMGWNANAEATGIEDLGNASTAKTVYAIFTDAPVYMVSFKANGHGSVPEDQAVLRTSGIVTQPEDLATPGFTFGGWYTDADCADAHRFNFNTVISSNITLYAKWTANTHTLKMAITDVNGVIIEYVADKVVSVDSVISAALPSTAGYAFTDWQTSSDGVVISDGEFRMPDNDVVMKTIRTTGKYELVWDTRHGTIISDANDYTDGKIFYGTQIVPPIVTRPGYEFKGWTLNITDTVKVFPTMPAEPQTYYAFWNPVKYSIAYKLFGATYGESGSAYGDVQNDITYGDVITEKDAPADITGYDFSGWVWKNANTGLEIAKPSTMPDFNLVVEGTYTIKKFDVTFDGNGQTINIAKQSVDTNTVVAKPENPSVPTLRFDGWFKEAACTNAWDFANDVVTDATTLYAKWTPLFKVTYNFDGVVVKEDYVGVGDVVTVADSAQKGLDVFTGWSSEEVTLDENNQFVMPSGDVTFTGAYQYVVIYKVNGEQSGATEAYVPGTEVTLRALPTDVGYDFTAWASEQVLIAEGKFTSIKGDVVVTSTKTATKYSITYMDGASAIQNTLLGEGSPMEFTIESDDIALVDAKLKTVAFEDGAYIFEGWYSEDTFQNKVTTIPAGSHADVTVYAKYVRKFRVTYFVDNVQDSTIWFLPNSTDIGKYIPKSEDYTFSGWKLWYYYDGGDKVDLDAQPTTIVDHDFVFEGYLTTGAIVYFNANGGNFGSSLYTEHSKMVTLYTNIADNDVPEATRDYYVFAGWSFDQQADEPEDLGQVTSQSDVYVYAVWDPEEYTITYNNLGDMTHTNQATYTIESNDITLAAPSDSTGYTFGGWFENANGTGDAVTTIVKGSNGHKTLFAKWNVKSVTLTFKDGETTYTTITQNYGTVVIAPENPTKEGYTFVGWDVEVPSTMPDEGITINARWQTKVTVEITGNVGSTEYDGGEHTVIGFSATTTKNVGYDVDNNVKLVEGAVATATTMNAGKVQMNLVAAMFENTDANFDVTFEVAQDGYSEVTPRTVTVKAKDSTKVYDGKPLVADGFTATGLVGDDVIGSATVSGSRTDVGSSENVASAAVLSVGLPANYNIVYEKGSLTITKATENEVGVTLANWTYGSANVPDPVVTGLGAETAEILYADASDTTLVGCWKSAKPTEIGNYFVKAMIAGTDDYVGGSAVQPFSITAKSAEDLIVTVNPNSGDYNGFTQFPSIVVKDGETVLEEGVDYTVTITKDGVSTEEMKDAGTYTIAITGTGVYGGSVQETYTIALATEDVTVALEDWTYGDKTVPDPVVTPSYVDNDKKTVQYAKAGSDTTDPANWTTEVPTDAGNYFVKVTVEDTDNYQGGSNTQEFAIEPKAATEFTVVVENGTYDGEPQTPTIVVKDGDAQLESPKDYTVSYPDDMTSVGKHEITINGNGNYDESTTVTYIISPEVKTVLPENVALVCDAGKQGAEFCNADKGAIVYVYGTATDPLPNAVMKDASTGSVDETWKFEGWYDNENLVDGQISETTTGKKVEAIPADQTDALNLYPKFTKEIEIVLSETPAVDVDIILDNNDNADSVSKKVNEAYNGLDPKPDNPTKPSSDKYDYTFKEYECTGSGINYTCEAVFDSTGRVFEVVENLPANAHLICSEGAKGAEFCNATEDGIIHQYGVETKPLPDAYIAGKDGTPDDDWKFWGWFDNENGIGENVESIDAEAYGSDITIFPFFTKDVEVVLSEDPDVSVDIIVDNNDDADSVTAKVNEAYNGLDPKPADPTKDKDDTYEYKFAGFECDMDFHCEATFDSLPYKMDIEVVYGDGKDDILDVTIWSTYTEDEIEKAIEEAFANHDPAIPLPTKDADEVYVYTFDKFVKNPETGRYEPSFTKTEKSFKIVYHMPSEAKLSKDVSSYTYGKRVVLPTAAIEDSKWEFKGWYTEENGLGTRVKVLNETDMGKKEFYAFFQMTLIYEVNDERASLEIIYVDDVKKSITRALQGVIPEDYDEHGVTYTFDKWELEDGVYVAKFIDATGIKAVAAAPRFNVVAAGRTLQITGAKMGAKIAVFDMSGRLVTTSMVQSGTQLVELSKAGSYVVRINNQAARVNVR